MDLENRVLKEFYPVKFRTGLLLGKNHHVRSLGFTKTGSFTCPDYYFSIQSPSVEEYVERKYLLNYNKNGMNKSEKIIYNTFSGLIGESIMRITIKEFFRRISAAQGIETSSFIKTDLNPFEDKRTIRANENYLLEGISRYNQTIIDLNCKAKRNITEYDGLFEYKTKNVDGLIICESKIGKMNFHLDETNNKNFYRKVIKPIKELYPEKELDFLLMGTHKELLQTNKKRNPLKERLLKLNYYLNEYNVGFIPMILPVGREEIDNIAESILGFNKLELNGITKIPEENKFIINPDTKEVLLIKGKRVEVIMKDTPQGYKITYDSGRLRKENKPQYLTQQTQTNTYPLIMN